MSVKVNSEDVFERGITLCEDFRYYEETRDVKISFNASSKVMTIWIYYITTGMLKEETKFLMHF